MSHSEKEGKKPIVLIFCDFYLPGFKSGGGMRTLVNTVERLGDKFDFRIVTRDHDGKTDTTPYSNVKIDGWNEVGKAKVFYISKGNITLKNIKNLIEEVSPKSIYSNSFFSTFTVLILLLRKFRRIGKLPFIIAPEGELSEGALQLKKSKKSLYMSMARTLGLYEDIIWKTTSAFEAEEVEKFKGAGGKIFIAPNMPPKHILPGFDFEKKPKKNQGAVKMVFLSRLHPKKNLKFMLEMLPNIEESLIKGKFLLDIYGPVDDEQYVLECENLIKELPGYLNVQMKGQLPHEQVVDKLFEYHFFVMPTLGENFGHIFVEALAAGCPLLISDRTPWINLSKKNIGWDLPLENREKWLEIINYCLNLGEVNYSKISIKAREYAVKWLADDEVEKATEKVIEHSLSEILTVRVNTV